jgi:hypothetical protein
MWMPFLLQYDTVRKRGKKLQWTPKEIAGVEQKVLQYVGEV